jgi:hypothetical protein
MIGEIDFYDGQAGGIDFFGSGIAGSGTNERRNLEFGLGGSDEALDKRCSELSAGL